MKCFLESYRIMFKPPYLNECYLRIDCARVFVHLNRKRSRNATYAVSLFFLMQCHSFIKCKREIFVFHLKCQKTFAQAERNFDKFFLFFFSARWTLPMTDVLAVRYGDDWISGVSIKEKQPTQPTSPTTVCPTNFILHYAVRGPKNKWRHHSVTMSHTDPRQVASWVKTIRNYLLGVYYRAMILGSFMLVQNFAKRDNS